MISREKLLALLAPEHIQYLSVSDLTEYLIDNGVTVLPCNIGDTVYFINARYNLLVEPKAQKVTEIVMYENEIVFKTETRVFTYANIGETVFLAEEDAIRKFTELRRNVITKSDQMAFEGATKELPDRTPAICGYYGRRCLRMYNTEGPNLPICMYCPLAKYVEGCKKDEKD